MRLKEFTKTDLEDYRLKSGNPTATLGQYMNQQQGKTFRKGGANDPDVIAATQNKAVATTAEPKPVSWQEIAKLNNITDPRKLKDGSHIELPNGQGSYYVTKGDTLSGIAQRLNTTGDPQYREPGSVNKTSVQPTVLNPEPKPTPKPTPKPEPTRPDYHDPVYDAPPDAKSAPAVRSGGVATAQDLEASKEDLKKYQADQKQRMADREKELAASEKELKNQQARRKKQTDQSGVDPKGIPKNSAPTNDQLKSIQKSVYDQESGSGSADTSKPNYAGAIGPMQILPKTFDWVKQLGKIPKDYDINNSKHNKAAGDALLGHYHDKYKGDPKKVYAAYYGGPSAVNKDGSINTHWRDKKNPKAPTVGQYIQQVLDRMKK